MLRLLQRRSRLFFFLCFSLSLISPIGSSHTVAQAQNSTSIPDNHLFVNSRRPLDTWLYPQNYDFAIRTQPQSEGTPIPNSDFTTLNGWTVSDSNAVQAASQGDNAAGSHLHLKSAHQWALSSAFTVGSTTQSLVLYAMAWTARSATESVPLFVEVASGANFDTYRLIGTVSGRETDQWQNVVLDIQAYQSQTIKLRLRSDNDRWRNGQARIDNLALLIQIPGWKPSDTNLVQMVNDDNRLSGAYLLLNDFDQSALSAPFSVPADAQSLAFDYAAWTPRDASEQTPLLVEVFSGSTFGTYTLISTHWGSQLQGWQTAVADLQPFLGQTIRLRLRSDTDRWRRGRARIDNLTLRSEVPGWQISSAQKVFVGAAQVPQGAPNIVPTIGQQNFDQVIATDTIPNANFTSGAQALPTSTYPPSPDFGSLNGWTVSDSSLVRIVNDVNNHSGPHLLLATGDQWALSEPLSVPTNTQSLLFDYAAWTDTNAVEQVPLFVELLSGPLFDTTTLIGTAFGQQTQGWKHAVLDVQAFGGQTVKLRFRSHSDRLRTTRARVDNLAFRIEVPDWRPSDANQVRLEQDSGGNGPNLVLDGRNQSAVSAAFVVPQDVDRLSFAYQAWAHNNAAEQSRLFVEALSGSAEEVSTLLGTVWGSQQAGWLPGSVDLQAFRGQPIRLRFRSDDDRFRDGRARVDDLSLRAELLGWVRSNTAAVLPEGTSLSAAADGPALFNPDFTKTRETRPSSEEPANFDFSSGRQALPSTTNPPSPDFASLNGWSVSDSSLVRVNNDPGNISGPALHFQATSQWASSTAFTLPNAAQSLRFDYAAWTDYNANDSVPLFVEIVAGSDFATSTLVGTAWGTKTQGWQQAVLDVQAFQGQTIKLRFRNDTAGWRNGQARIDNLALAIEAPQWKPSDSNLVRLKQDSNSINGGYLELNGTDQSALSEPFIVAWGTQSLRFDYQAWNPSDPTGLVPMAVEVFSGADYATYTLVGTASGSQNQGWQPAVLDIQRFQGHRIKLRFRSDSAGWRQGRARVDNVMLATEVPEWVPSDSNLVQIAQEGTHSDGAYARLAGANQWLLSLAFPVPEDAQQLSFRYTAWSQQGTDVSARLFVEILSGNEYDVSTLLSTLQGSQNQGWQQANLDLRGFRGRTIKLRLRSDDDSGRQGRAQFDTFRLTRDPATTTSQYQPPAYAITLNQENAWVESLPFTLPETTGRVRFSYVSWDATNANQPTRLFAEVLSGADFKVNTLAGTVLGSHNQGWQSGDLDISAFRGRTIKLRFRSDDDRWRKGRARISDLSFREGTTNIPAGWDYQQQHYLQLDGSNQWATSSPFNVPLGKGRLSMAYLAWTQRNANEQTPLFVEVLSGTNYAQVSALPTLHGSATGGWREQTVLDLRAFEGQTIRVRFRADNDQHRDGRVRIAQVTPPIEVAPPPPSSYACRAEAVTQQAPVLFTTPSEPYVVRVTGRYSNAWVRFTAGMQGSEHYATGYLVPLGHTLGYRTALNTLARLDFLLPPPNEQVFPDRYALPIFVEICTFGDWEKLISFRPPQAVQDAIYNRTFNYNKARKGQGYMHRIEEGLGNINLDYYEIRIKASQMPLVPLDLNKPFDAKTGTRFTPEQLFDYLRIHINLFTNNSAEFNPYDTYPDNIDAVPAGDATTWRSSTNPVGSVLSIVLLQWGMVRFERGSVVTSAYSKTHTEYLWIFSSIYTPFDTDHPVSGNRQFGLRQDGDDWIFYIRAADRATRFHYDLLGEQAVFAGADTLWQEVSSNIALFANDENTGAAEVTPRSSARYFWPVLCSTYWPTTGSPPKTTITCR